MNFCQAISITGPHEGSLDQNSSKSKRSRQIIGRGVYVKRDGVMI